MARMVRADDDDATEGGWALTERQRTRRQPAGEVYDWYVRGVDAARERQPGGRRRSCSPMPAAASRSRPACWRHWPAPCSTRAATPRPPTASPSSSSCSPDNDYARFGLGLSRLRLGDLAAAVEQLALAAAMRPHRPTTSRRCARRGPPLRARERSAVSAAEPEGRPSTPAGAARYDTAAARPRRRGLRRPGRRARRAGGGARPRAEAGMRLAYVTNNAARTPDDGRRAPARARRPGRTRRRRHLGPGRRDAARRAGARRARRVLVVGGEGLASPSAERGLVPVRAADDEPAAVVQGFSPDVGWRLLAEGTYAVAAACLDRDEPGPSPSRRRAGTAPGNGAAGRRHRAR